MTKERKKEGFDNERLHVLPESMQSQAGQHPLMKQLYCTDIGYFPDAKYHYRERKNGCASTILICCVNGKGWFQTDGHKKLPVTPGHLAVIPAGSPHAYGSEEEDPWSIYWMHIQGEHIEAFLGKTAMNIELCGSQLNRWIELFEECWEHAANGWIIPNMVYISQTIRHMLAIVYTQGTNLNVSSKQNRYIEEAVVFMRERMDQQLSLDDLAACTNLSKPHLITLFNRVIGYPPLDYFLRIKVQQACTYLDFTDKSIKEIAASLGFQDPYYFSRQFRKVMGLSPATYRKIKKG